MLFEDADKTMRALQEKIQHAQELHEKSKEEFRRVAASATSSPTEIAQAFEAECDARNAWTYAIAQLNHFLSQRLRIASEPAARDGVDDRVSAAGHR